MWQYVCVIKNKNIIKSKNEYKKVMNKNVD